MRLLVKIIERKEVKAEIEKLNTKLKDKEFAKLFYKELDERRISKEFCDLVWLQHITNRIEYFQKNKIQQERKTNDVLTQFIKN